MIVITTRASKVVMMTMKPSNLDRLLLALEGRKEIEIVGRPNVVPDQPRRTVSLGFQGNGSGSGGRGATRGPHSEGLDLVWS